MKTQNEWKAPNAHQAAYPFIIPDNPVGCEGECGNGLSKRELIAAMFGAALASNQTWMQNALGRHPDNPIEATLAEAAVSLTDSLLSKLAAPL